MPPILSASLAINHCGDEVDLTLRCIQNADLEVTVFICDISPDELTSERLKWSFPGVIVLPQGKNTGVSLAHNAVLPHLQSKYHLFLDPGVSFHPSLLRTMVSYMEAHPNIAVLSPRFFRENGQELFFPRRQISLRYMLGTALAGFGGCFRHWNMEYTFADNDVEMPAPVDSAPVTFLLARTGVFSSLNGFDPAFTSTQEDADLCRRIQEQRLGSVVFHPDMAVYCRLPDAEHFSRTARTHRLRTVLRYFMKWGITW